MPLHSDKTLSGDARLLIWRIEESPAWFLSRLHLDDDELEKYNGFRVDKRRVHWLAYRYMLKNIVGKGKQIRLRYDQHDKPFIDLSNEQISVSHSGIYACVIISEKHNVGIDVEEISPRLHKIGDKFLSKEETGEEISHMTTENLCVHWCAKEALYKLHGERKLDFRDQILVKGVPAGREGEFHGMIRTAGSEQHYQLRSEKLDNYYMVYVVDAPE
jgi:phosphopantetheinyl transferase